MRTQAPSWSGCCGVWRCYQWSSSACCTRRGWIRSLSRITATASQAHYLALAGVERAKALLYHDYLTRRQTSKNHTGSLYDDAKDFENIAFDRGHYRISRHDDTGPVYGISDEESRLNINVATADELTNIDGMTPDIVAAIIDWRDADNEVTPGGPKRNTIPVFSLPINRATARLQTVRELLLVRGIGLDLLEGNDVNTQDNDEPGMEGGWSAILTVDSTDKNVSADGKDRINVQTADQTTLASVPGISTSIASAIIAYRGQKNLKPSAICWTSPPPKTPTSAVRRIAPHPHKTLQVDRPSLATNCSCKLRSGYGHFRFGSAGVSQH